MYRPAHLAIAMAALGIATAPLLAHDDASAERAFAAAARGFNDCLFAAADAGQPLADRCLSQETAFRQYAMRLRLSRGQSEQAATSAIDTDVIAGRRMAMRSLPQRYALAR